MCFVEEMLTYPAYCAKLINFGSFWSGFVDDEEDEKVRARGWGQWQGLQRLFEEVLTIPGRLVILWYSGAAVVPTTSARATTMKRPKAFILLQFERKHNE